MVSQTTLNKTAEYYQWLLTHGVIRVGSTMYTVPIDRMELTNNVIRVYLLVDHSFTGTVNRVQLYDRDGDLFAQRDDSISKTAEQGILVRFTFTVQEV